MYKFIFIIIVLFSIQLKSEEFKSMFGFTITFPDEYMFLENLNSEQLNELMKIDGFNTDVLNKIELNSDGEYFVLLRFGQHHRNENQRFPAINDVRLGALPRRGAFPEPA